MGGIYLPRAVRQILLLQTQSIGFDSEGIEKVSERSERASLVTKKKSVKRRASEQREPATLYTRCE